MIFQRAIRTVISLIVVLVAFAAYSVAAKTLVGSRVRDEGAPISHIEPERPIKNDRFVGFLKTILPKDAWELERSKILRNDQTALIFKQYEQTEPNQVIIKPCTVVVLSKNPDRQSPLLLQATQGAVLHFDRPLDFGKAKVGKPIAGRLRGPIRISSPADSSGKGKLEIETSNVQINKKKIWTASDVKFEYDGSVGRGRNLIINLNPPTAKPTDSKLDSIRSIELVNLNELYLDPISGNVFGKDDADQKESKKQSPVQVTCNGPCKLDLQTGTIEFSRNVDLRQIHNNAAPDFLQCERLVFTFDKRLLTSKTDKEDSSKGFRQLIATGSPVVLNAPSKFAYLRGSRLSYDWETKSFRVDSQQESMFRHQKKRAIHQFESKSFHYQVGKDREIGELHASGPGAYTGQFDDDKEPTNIRWKGSLELKPLKSGHLLLVNHDVDANLGTEGRIVADQFRALLEKGPRKLGKLREGSSSTQSLRPKRFFAVGRVNFKSPKLDASCEELEIGFSHRPSRPTIERNSVASTQLSSLKRPIMRAVYDGRPGQNRQVNGIERSTFSSERQTQHRLNGAASRGGNSRIRNSSAIRVGASSARRDRLPKIDLQGRKVQLQLVMSGSELQEVKRVEVQGNAELTGVYVHEGRNDPFRVVAEQLHVADPNSGSAKVHTIGTPSKITYGDLTLTAGRINLDQGKNRFWVDGAGKASTKMAKNFQGEVLPKPVPVHMTWQKQMDFDGHKFEFSGQANVSSKDLEMNAEKIHGQLSQQVSFQKTARSIGIEVAQVSAEGAVQAAYRTVEYGRTASTSFFRGPQMTYRQKTGDLSSTGPGQIVVVKKGFKSNAALKPDDRRNGSGADDSRLTYVQIDFRDQLQANINREQGEFRGNVIALYGPINDWDEQIPDHQPLGKDDIRLQCDSMEMSQIAVTSDLKTADVRALGNVTVTGQMFNATGHQLLFDQAKNLITMRGSGRRDAQIQVEPTERKGRMETSSREIRFSPDSLELQFDKQRFLDFRTIGR